MSKLTNFLHWFVPMVEKLPAEIEAEIAKVHSDAAAKVKSLKSGVSIAAIKADAEARVTAAVTMVEHYKELVEAKKKADLEAAQNVLPPLNLPTGATGPTGA